MPNQADQARVYPVRKKCSHIGMHGDEFLCNEIGCRFGQFRLPGFATAPLELIDAGLHLETGRDGWHYLKNERKACMGVCGGPFDEHGGSSEGFTERNSATQMASFLEVQNDPGLVPILTKSLRSDRTYDKGPFDLDQLIKSWWGIRLTLADILEMYSHIFTGLYHRFSGRDPVAKPDTTFRNLIARWMLMNFRADDPKLDILLAELRTGKQVADRCKLWDNRSISQTLNLDMRKGRSGAKTPFDLEGLWEAMWAAGVPKDTIDDIVMTSLDAKHAEQKRFCDDEKQFGDLARYVPAHKEHPYSFAVVHTDSDMINRAAAKQDRDLDVLVMQLSTGHIRIFDLHKRVPMDYVAVELRIAEYRKQGGKRYLPWADLASKGTLRVVLPWYNSHDGLGVFNSTMTSPGTPMTWLPMDEVVACINRALAKAYRREHVSPIKEFNLVRDRAQQREREARIARSKPAVPAATQ